MSAQGGKVRGWSLIRIVGPSMEPAMANGQIWLMTPGCVRPGRVVVFAEPGRPELLSVKRVHGGGKDEGWWVLGDNADYSTDSRDFGSVASSGIRGVLRLRLR
jgi:hypothetical protein